MPTEYIQKEEFEFRYSIPQFTEEELARRDQMQSLSDRFVENAIRRMCEDIERQILGLSGGQNAD